MLLLEQKTYKYRAPASHSTLVTHLPPLLAFFLKFVFGSKNPLKITLNYILL